MSCEESWQLQNLPVELLLEIVGYLGVKDIGTLRASCKRFHECTQEMIRQILRFPDWILKVRTEHLGLSDTAMGAWADKLRIVERLNLEIYQEFFQVNDKLFATYERIQPTIKQRHATVYVVLLSSDTLQVCTSLKICEGDAFFLCYAPKNRLLIFKHEGEKIHYHQMSTDMNKIVESAHICDGDITHAIFTPAEDAFFVWRHAKLVKYQVADWKLIQIIDLHEWNITSLVVCESVLIASHGRHLWWVDLSSTHYRRIYEYPTSYDILAIAVSPDGKYVATNYATDDKYTFIHVFTCDKDTCLYIKQEYVCQDRFLAAGAFQNGCLFFASYCQQLCLFSICHNSGYLYCWRVPDYKLLWKRDMGANDSTCFDILPNQRGIFFQKYIGDREGKELFSLSNFILMK